MKISAFLCAVLLSFVVVAGANASVLTFDDITTGGGTGFHTYGGLTWSNISNIHKDTQIFGITNHGYNNGVVSGSYVAMNEFGLAANVASNSGLFDFDGTYLTAAWNDGLNIKVVGELDGIEKYNQTVTVDTYFPTWFNFHFFGIDKLVFLPSGGTSTLAGHPGGQHFAMDNFTFSAASVPIPSTTWLLGSGLIGLLVSRRKLGKYYFHFK